MTKHNKEKAEQMEKDSQEAVQPEATGTPVQPTNEVIEGDVIIGEEVMDEEDLMVSMRAENEKLKEALQAEQEQSEKYLKNWQFSQADLQNYKKRVEKDEQARRELMKATSLQHYIEVLDDIELALKNAGDESAAEWAKGIELIHRKMLGVLEREGVTRVDCDGEFDPMVHEAVSSEPHPEVEPGHIIEVLQQGYQLGNRTLRPARVRVAI
ncbi:MAG: nucleotide exchange factor GrpE [Anaerolineae bacterium]|jgi:molecular chaperone GrpE|nr:nucleotide exchange factor GrpE [Anaerolineae bacterium]